MIRSAADLTKKELKSQPYNFLISVPAPINRQAQRLLEAPKQTPEKAFRLLRLKPLHQTLKPIVCPQIGKIRIRPTLPEVLIASLQASCPARGGGVESKTRKRKHNGMRHQSLRENS